MLDMPPDTFTANSEKIAMRAWAFNDTVLLLLFETFYSFIKSINKREMMNICFNCGMRTSVVPVVPATSFGDF